MNKEQILEVIKEYLGREEGGSLVADTSDYTIHWTPDTGIIDWGTYVVVSQEITNDNCDCGERYNDDCEQCTDGAYHLLEKVQHEFSKLEETF